jgi:hypothetical protein
MAYKIKDYINSFRTKLADTISKQQIEPVIKRKTNKFLFEKKNKNDLIILVTI